jgi:hypothetical protein
MMFIAASNNISVLLVEETGVPGISTHLLLLPNTRLSSKVRVGNVPELFTLCTCIIHKNKKQNNQAKITNYIYMYSGLHYVFKGGLGNLQKEEEEENDRLVASH